MDTHPAAAPDPGDREFQSRYRAVAARDTRFDGQFITAVRTTGVYCRPSCPARTPNPENVTFFLTSAAAHQAGYRACRRCLPEAAPGTTQWDLRGDLVGRAMRLVADGVVDRHGVSGLAARLGYSPRQLQRLMVAELGAGPLAIARAQRAQTARALLIGTELRLADIAFAAGFGSIRQFNDTIAEVFGLSPSELRSRARTGTGDPQPPAGGDAVRLRLALPVRAPFDARGVFAFLAARAVAEVETTRVEGEVLCYARTLDLPHGPGAAEITLTPIGPAEWRVELLLELTALSDVAVAVARVRRLLDLDADPAAVDTALGTDPALAPLIAANPGVRVPGTVDPHELVIRAIVGQQISVAAARTHLGRLALAGIPYQSAIPGLSRIFPSAGRVAEEARDRLRLPERNLETIVTVTSELASGELVVDVGQDPVDLRNALVSRRGIGPWTAAYIAMRVLGDPDAWLEGDVALLAGAQRLGMIEEGTRTQQFRALAERAHAWSPWRAYAQLHLWAAA